MEAHSMSVRRLSMLSSLFELESRELSVVRSLLSLWLRDLEREKDRGKVCPELPARAESVNHRQ